MNEPNAAERWALLRMMRGTDGIVASEALIEMCGMVELMHDPHKHHKDRLRHGRPRAEEVLRRDDARYGAPPAGAGDRRCDDGPRLVAFVDARERTPPRGGPGNRGEASAPGPVWTPRRGVGHQLTYTPSLCASRGPFTPPLCRAIPCLSLIAHTS